MIPFPSLRYEPPPIYFMHIPKTAGSSLQQLLFSAYAPDQIIRPYATTIHEINSTEIRDFRCISSHFGPGLLPFIDRTRVACITMLRDPVEQRISQIYYRQSRLNQCPTLFQPAYVAQMHPLRKADLRTWLDASVPGSGNQQTRCLGNVSNLRPYFKDGEIGRMGQPLLQPLELPTLTDSATMSQIATCAHRRLEEMALVGITERFAESADSLCALLGIPLPAQLPAKNIGTYKSQIQTHSYRMHTPQDLIERIEAENCYDLELYAHACELFEMQLAQQQAYSRRTISLAPRLRMPSLYQAKRAAGRVKHKLLHLVKPVLVRRKL